MCVSTSDHIIIILNLHFRVDTIYTRENFKAQKKKKKFQVTRPHFFLWVCEAKNVTIKKGTSDNSLDLTSKTWHAHILRPWERHGLGPTSSSVNVRQKKC